MDSSTQFVGRSVLITGTNRGLGTALVDEALRRGAARVYAAARRPLTHDDARVTPLLFDITDPRQIARRRRGSRSSTCSSTTPRWPSSTTSVTAR